MCENPTTLYRRRGINGKTGRNHAPVSFAYIRDNGLSPAAFEEFLAPCGHCFSCLKHRAAAVSVRAYHESLCHRHSVFVTLTFDQEHLPHSLDHKIFQDFMKRLRKRLGIAKVRYLMCGEYGERSLRPHFHAILFGISPDERTPVAVVRNDDNLLGSSRTLYTGYYRSKVIEQSWPFGHVYIGHVSPNSICYVAGYTMKKYLLGRTPEWYAERGFEPEYCKWSRRPGLGSMWYEKNEEDLFRSFEDLFGKLHCNDRVRFGDGQVVAPRYYIEKLYLTDRQKFDILLATKAEESNGSKALNQVEVDERLLQMRCRLETQQYRVLQRPRL